MSNCNLCARSCSIDRDGGELGFCQASSCMQIGRADLHYWEEPPLKNSGAIFFVHCSLKCIYCQNWKISQRNSGMFISPKELADITFELRDKGAENINIVTGSHYASKIREGLKIAQSKGMDLPIIWNTASYDSLETISLMRDIVDVWLADFKYVDGDLAHDLSSARDYCSVATSGISKMVEGETFCEKLGCKSVIVRHLILPGMVDHSKRAIKHLVDNFGDSIKLSIMSQYTPVINDRHSDRAMKVLSKYPSLTRTVSESEYEEVLDYADSLGVEDYFWQEGGCAVESFIPDFDLA